MNSNQPTEASTSGALREGRDEGRQSMHPIMTNSTADLDAADAHEQLSSTGKDLRDTHRLVSAKSDMSPLFRETKKNDGALAMLL